MPPSSRTGPVRRRTRRPPTSRLPRTSASPRPALGGRNEARAAEVGSRGREAREREEPRTAGHGGVPPAAVIRSQGREGETRNENRAEDGAGRPQDQGSRAGSARGRAQERR